MAKRRRVLLFSVFALIVTIYVLLKLNVSGTDFDKNTDIARYASGNLKVHFIGVGQADCILVQSDGRNLLIDAGSNENEHFIVSYLQGQGISYLDYVIATHAHVDHIGGMDAVIENFPIGVYFLPEEEYDTNSFKDVLKMLEKKQVTVHMPKFKENFYMGKARFMFITPDSDRQYEDVNDSSLGIRLSNGAHSFLFCGDISKKMEKQILDSDVYIRSDVMKLNHHGSSDANSWKFLKTVDPAFVVISCGRKNEFGHPHKSVMRRVKALHAGVFRTDKQGTILFESDGKHLTCNVKPMEK